MQQSREDYLRTLRELSDRIVEAQRPIRILDSIKWDASVEEAFFASGGTAEPPVDRSYYEARPLGFDPASKKQEFEEIDRDVSRTLGRFNPVGSILRRMCEEYTSVVRMLEARGTPEFSRYSQRLYGGAKEAFHAGDPSLADFGVMMSEALSSIDQSTHLQSEERTITGEQAVEILRRRIDEMFREAQASVRVMVSDGIVADAAAGSDYLKIRKDASFNAQDLRLLEIHEGWVHLGTTLNGSAQPVCTFLSKGPPSSTLTQEGLAILMEIIAFASHPSRLRRLTNRIRAVHLAEDGATFRDIFRFFREQGLGELDAYNNAARVFRGSTPTGGPFTKDICYSKGFILVYNYILLAVRKGLLERIPLLFCGKSRLEDMRTLAQLVDEGIVVPPKHLPPQIADLSALTAWMCYSHFISRLSLDRIEADYASLL